MGGGRKIKIICCLFFMIVALGLPSLPMFQRLIAAKTKKSAAKAKTDPDNDSVYCEKNLLPSRYAITDKC